jgi:hypothetical protein
MIHTLTGNSRPNDIQMINRAYRLARDVFSICHGSPACPVSISMDDAIDIEIKTVTGNDTVIATLTSKMANCHHKIILADSFLLSYTFMPHEEALQQLVNERKQWHIAQSFNGLQAATLQVA